MSQLGKKLNTGLILRSPRITEKSTVLAENKSGPVYIFEVASTATKPIIAKTFVLKYKIKPQKVNIVNLPAKKIFKRGIRGSKSGVKKALVYLKVGEKIEIV